MVAEWLANGWPMVGQRLANGWPMLCQLLVNGWPMVGSGCLLSSCTTYVFGVHAQASWYIVSMRHHFLLVFDGFSLFTGVMHEHVSTTSCHAMLLFVLAVVTH